MVGRTTFLALVSLLSLASLGDIVSLGRSDAPDSVVPLSPLTQSNDWTAQHYIQSGLVHMWDARWNAGWGTNDPNAAIWKDLVGDMDLSRGHSSYTWGEGYALLTRLYSGNNGLGWYNTGHISGDTVFCEVVFQLLGNPENRNDGLVSFSYKQNTSSKTSQLGVKNGILQYGDAGGGVDVSDTYNGVHSASFDIYYNTGPRYFDGARAIPSAVVYTMGSNSGAHIGSFWYGCNARIYCVRLYRKTLSTWEVEWNNTVDRMRFGIQ